MQTTTWNSPNSQRLLMLGLLVFFIGLSVHYALTKAIDGRSAILRWDDQLRDLGDGVNIAEKYAYPNPPIMAILLYPLDQRLAFTSVQEVAQDEQLQLRTGHALHPGDRHEMYCG